jgi:hypothetical protein
MDALLLFAFAAMPAYVCAPTCCKALVCHIKEGHVTFGLAQVRDLLPLLRGGVDPSGVVGTACSRK